MARIVCKKKGSSMFVELSGEASLQNAPKAKEFFLSLVSGGCTECRINISGLSEIDLPYLELLISFRRTMERENRKTVFDPLPEGHPLAGFMALTGIRYALFRGEEVHDGI